MSLENKKSGIIHRKSGDDLDKIKKHYDDGLMLDPTDRPDEYPHLSALIYQIELMQQDIDELRRFSGTEENRRITNNTDLIDINTKNIPPIKVLLPNSNDEIGLQVDQGLRGTTLIINYTNDKGTLYKGQILLEEQIKKK
tara:strand:+ start:19798 stop:20217 length:420 start_codon:yes stop_codon:yes gene_type:complete